MRRVATCLPFYRIMDWCYCCFSRPELPLLLVFSRRSQHSTIAISLRWILTRLPGYSHELVLHLLSTKVLLHDIFECGSRINQFSHLLCCYFHDHLSDLRWWIKYGWYMSGWFLCQLHFDRFPQLSTLFWRLGANMSPGELWVSIQVLRALQMFLVLFWVLWYTRIIFVFLFSLEQSFFLYYSEYYFLEVGGYSHQRVQDKIPQLRDFIF